MQHLIRLQDPTGLYPVFDSIKCCTNSYEAAIRNALGMTIALKQKASIARHFNISSLWCIQTQQQESTATGAASVMLEILAANGPCQEHSSSQTGLIIQSTYHKLQGTSYTHVGVVYQTTRITRNKRRSPHQRRQWWQTKKNLFSVVITSYCVCEESAKSQKRRSNERIYCQVSMLLQHIIL